MTELSRPFQLHLPGDRVLHGAEFPSGRAFVDAPGDDAYPPGSTYGLSLGAALDAFPGGVVLWPEDLAQHAGD
jgi:hypothetical protein